jgi:CRP-like cAMP-binding protein
MKIPGKFKTWQDTESHPAGSVIFSAGDTADVTYLVLSGEVELTIRGESLGIEREGGIIGMMATDESATRSATARALSEVRLALINREQLNGLMLDDREFSMHMMTKMVNRLRSANKFITRQFD